MDKFLILFIVFLTLCFISSIVLSLNFYKKKEKERRVYLTKNKLEEYERLISAFLKEHSIEEGTEISEIVEKIGYTLEEKEKLENGHEAEKVGTTIIVDKTLSFRVKNFGIAHEVAHVVKGDEDSAARAPHSFKGRSVDEQICDYIAAALLLPYSEMIKRLDKINYASCSRRDRVRFISALADEKNVSEEVVIRRINEMKELLA